jgi:hypothetical protein
MAMAISKRSKNQLLGVGAVMLMVLAGLGNKYYQDKVVPVAEAQRAIIYKLKDPGSAEFYNLTAFKYTSSVCGEVNAKNAMGGYVGRKRFVYVTSTKDVNIEEPESDKERLFEKLYWNTHCTGA